MEKENITIVKNTPTGIILTTKRGVETKNNETAVCDTCYGYYWDDFEETYSINEEIVKKLIQEGTIKGSTYIEMMLSECGIQPYELRDDIVDEFECSFHLIEEEKEQEKANWYFKLIDKEIVNKYDNIVCIVKDNPNYTHSKTDHITSTAIVKLKKGYTFIIDICYPTKRDYSTITQEDVKKVFQKLKVNSKDLL